jgi:hypothetical protein
LTPTLHIFADPARLAAGPISNAAFPMFIILPLTITGLIAFFVHRFLWEAGPINRGNRILDDYKVYQANESNEEELDKIKKLNLK